MGDMEGRKKNLGLEAFAANIFPNGADASFFLAFEADGLLFRKDFYMETNLPADDQSPETPPIEAIAPATDAPEEHPAWAPADPREQARARPWDATSLPCRNAR